MPRNLKVVEPHWPVRSTNGPSAVD